MEITAIDTAWYKLSGMSKPVLDYVKRGIPTTHRYYRDGAWYVHKKYVENVCALAGVLLPSNSLILQEDPWEVLHLRPGAPQAIIKAVFRELAKTLHPDAGGSQAEFTRVKLAYEKLTKV